MDVAKPRCSIPSALRIRVRVRQHLSGRDKLGIFFVPTSMLNEYVLDIVAGLRVPVFSCLAVMTAKLLSHPCSNRRSHSSVSESPMHGYEGWSLGPRVSASLRRGIPSSSRCIGCCSASVPNSDCVSSEPAPATRLMAAADAASSPLMSPSRIDDNG